MEIVSLLVFFKIFRTSDNVPGVDAAPTITPISSHGLYIDSKNDKDLTCVTVPLATNTSIACNIPKDVDLVSSLPIAIIPSVNVGLYNGIVLNTDYSAMEPYTTSMCNGFGKRFGVPFWDKHSSWLCRKITSLELISCYSIDIRYLMNSICQHQLNSKR